MKKILVIIILCITVTVLGNTYTLVVGTGDIDSIETVREFKEGLKATVFHTEKNITFLTNPRKIDLESYFLSLLSSGTKEDKYIFFYLGIHEITNKEITLYLDQEKTTKVELNDLLSFIPEYARSVNITIILCGEREGYYNHSYIENFSKGNNVGIIIYSADNIEEIKYFYTDIINGLSGKANTRNDYITFDELSHYLERNLSKIEYSGEKNIVVIESVTDEEKDLLSIISSQENIPTTILETYTKILTQEPSQDTQIESKIREYLNEFEQNRNLNTLIEKTQDILENKEQKQISQGYCTIEITAENELAKKAEVYINGDLKGNLSSGFIRITGMAPGAYVLTFNSEEINKIEKEIYFENDFEIQEIKIKAEKAERMIKIYTKPSGADIYIDGTPIGRSPTEKELPVGDEYTIKAELKGHYHDSKKVYIEEKGEPLNISLTLREYPPPEKPQNTNPVNGETVNSGYINLKWKCIEPQGKQLTYTLYFGTTRNPEEITTTKSESYTVEANKRDQTYYWKIKAESETGKTAQSDLFYFSTYPNKPPTAPEPNTIKDGDKEVQSGNTKLQWKSTDPEGDKITYELYFGKTAYPPQYTTTNNNYTYLELERGQKYYWRVKATDEYGASTTSPIYSFTTATNNPPTFYTYIKPKNNAEVEKGNVELSWSCTDKDNDDIKYEVYFGKTRYTLNKETTTTLTRYTVKADEYNQKYYWKIKAIDEYGATTETDINSFTTKENQPPQFGSKIYPEDGYIGASFRKLTLKWNCEDPEGETIKYAVYLGKEGESLKKIADDITEQEYTIKDLTKKANYKWRIVAKDASGKITYSNIWKFRTSKDYTVFWVISGGLLLVVITLIIYALGYQ